jgi:hypothetical protein
MIRYVVFLTPLCAFVYLGLYDIVHIDRIFVFYIVHGLDYVRYLVHHETAVEFYDRAEYSDRDIDAYVFFGVCQIFSQHRHETQACLYNVSGTHQVLFRVSGPTRSWFYYSNAPVRFLQQGYYLERGMQTDVVHLQHERPIFLLYLQG